MDPVNKAVLDALVALHANMLAQDLDNQAERPTEEEFQACMAAASAAIRAATEEGAPAPADPMDWPLPCDVVIGHITMRKGLKLSALVKPMQVLYEMTEGASLAAQAELAVAVPSDDMVLAAAQAPAAQGDALDAAREFPPLTLELASILGTMCFQCIPFAQALRIAGHKINTRAEDEQAATLHWMLGHYFRHGDDGWRKAAVEDMERMRADAAIAAQAKEGGAA